MDADEFKEAFSLKEKFENVKVPEGEMSPRERFFSIMEFKKPDRIIDNEFGYWKDTLKRWHNEGLPEYVNSNEKADLYFGFDNWRKRLPSNAFLNPSFEPEIISDDGEHQVIYDANRVKCEIFSDGADTIPHYLDFPIKDKESYQEFKKKLQPTIEKRIPENITKIGEQVKDRNYILENYAGSTAGVIRNWMGFENIAMGIYDQPELLNEILEDLSNIRCAIATEVTKNMSIDLVAWWEDIAFKTGPIVTPSFFIDSCGPTIKKVMDIYKNSGTLYSYVDCDGNFSRLMPGWFDNGVNIMFPLEVASGIHPETLRQDHGAIRMMGGVDKTVLLLEKSDIKKELLKLKPLVDQGGYIPHVDHRVQADVSYENYLYYLEVKRDLFEIPNKIIK
jgi:Uroporphyrinogen decarboxylase (URO-D)